VQNIFLEEGLPIDNNATDVDLLVRGLENPIAESLSQGLRDVGYVCHIYFNNLSLARSKIVIGKYKFEILHAHIYISMDLTRSKLVTA